jgi:hypothetical protein
MKIKPTSTTYCRKGTAESLIAGNLTGHILARWLTKSKSLAQHQNQLRAGRFSDAVSGDNRTFRCLKSELLDLGRQPSAGRPAPRISSSQLRFQQTPFCGEPILTPRAIDREKGPGQDACNS